MRWIEPILAAALTFTPGWTQERLVSALDVEDGTSYDFVAGEPGGGLLVAIPDGGCELTFAGLRATSPPAPVAVQADLWSGPLALGDGSVAALDTRDCGGSTLDLADLDAAGRVERRMALPISGSPEDVELALGPDGSLAAVWNERTAGRRDRLRMVVRGADGRISPAVTLHSRRMRGRVDASVDDLDVARDADGSVLVAWSRERAVRAVTVSPSGGVGAPVVVGRSMGDAAVQVALRGERAVVAWGTGVGGGARNQRTRMYAAVRDGGRFRPAQQLERAPVIDEAHEAAGPEMPEVAIGADGHALVAWNTVTASRYGSIGQVAAARPRHRFGKRRTVTVRGVVGGVAFAQDGRPLVGWAEDDHVFLERGGAREPVATGPDLTAPDVTVLADGRVRVSWSSGREDTLALSVATGPA